MSRIWGLMPWLVSAGMMPLTACRFDSSATWMEAFRPMRLMISSRVAVLDSSLYLNRSVSKQVTTTSSSLKIEEHTWINTTSAPASAKAKAIACPMPLVPPVTTAVWPLSEKRELIVADIVAITSKSIEWNEFLSMSIRWGGGYDHLNRPRAKAERNPGQFPAY